MIDGMQNHFILCGFGRMGEIIARELQRQDAAFVVIEAERALLVLLPNREAASRDKKFPRIVRDVANVASLRCFLLFDSKSIRGAL